MQFTFVFESAVGEDLSYLLCFIPCPVWKRGDTEIINPHPEYPDFLIGDIETLLKIEGLKKITAVTIVIHECGHGAQTDLDNILTELKVLGLSYNTVFLRS